MSQGWAAIEAARSALEGKPLIGLEDGVIVGLGAARTRAKAYARMVEMMCQHGGRAFLSGGVRA